MGCAGGHRVCLAGSEGWCHVGPCGAMWGQTGVLQGQHAAAPHMCGVGCLVLSVLVAVMPRSARASCAVRLVSQQACLHRGVCSSMLLWVQGGLGAVSRVELPGTWREAAPSGSHGMERGMQRVQPQLSGWLDPGIRCHAWPALALHAPLCRALPPTPTHTGKPIDSTYTGRPCKSPFLQ